MDIKFRWIGWCRELNHDKVWALLILNDGRYATFWGRRGKKLSCKVANNRDTWTMIKDKTRKGYQEITPSRLDQVYPEFRQDLEQTAFWTLLGA